MKIQVRQEDLKDVVLTASRFISTRPQIPVLGNVLLESSKNKLTVSSTNLEMFVKMDIGAKTETEGLITVPARPFLEIVSNLKSGNLNLSLDKENLVIKSEGFSSRLAGLNASEFPKISVKKDLKLIKLPKKGLFESIESVIFASSFDETRPVLTGVLFYKKANKLNLVATDGYRLSLSEVGEFDFPAEKIIVPKNILNEVVRFADKDDYFEFGYDDSENMVVFKFESALLLSRVIAGEYPDFEKIIPQEFKTKVLLDKDDLVRGLKLASVFAKDSSNVVRILIDSADGKIKFLAENQLSGSQESVFDAKIEGEDLEIGFNYKFLLDFVESVKGESVKMSFNDSSSPAEFRDASNKNYLHIIMPVKI